MTLPSPLVLNFMTNPTVKVRDPRVLGELLKGDKVKLVCEIHNYVAGGVPRKHTGCQKCIMVDFIAMIAKVPPAQQLEEWEKFEGIVRAMCELEDEGNLDINLTQHPEITIERNVSSFD